MSELIQYQAKTLAAYSSGLNRELIAQSVKGRKITELRESGAITLASICKEAGRSKSEELIAQFVAALANQLNLAGKISKEAILAIAEDVYDIGYYLNVQELAFFFNSLRKGQYGSMYENLNSEKVCIHLEKFLTARAHHFKRKSQNEQGAIIKHEQINGLHQRTGEQSFQEASREALKRYNKEK